MISVYLASPYTHANPAVMETRYLTVCRIVAQYARDYHIYSPIVHWHPIAVLYNLPKDWEFWKKINAKDIEMRDEFWFLQDKGWANSQGMKEEFTIAKNHKKPHKFILP